MDHFSTLRRGKHVNKRLQNSYNKHGEDAFVFEVLEECSVDVRFELEQLYLDIYKPEYNISSTAFGGTCDRDSRILSESQIVDMFCLYASGYLLKDIKNKFDINGGSVLGLILDRCTYKNIKIDEDVLRIVKEKRSVYHVHDRKFSRDDVNCVLNLYVSGFTKTELSKLYKVSKSTILDIIERRSYRDFEISESLENMILIRNLNKGSYKKK